MNKKIAVIMTALLAASSAFALPTFNAKTQTDASKRVESVLSRKAQQVQAAQQQEYVKVYEGVLVNGYFSKDNLKSTVYQGKGFKIEFAIQSKNGSSFGNVTFKVFAAQNAKPSIKTEKKYVNGVSRDPHAPVAVYVSVKINGQESKVEAITVDAQDLAEYKDCDYPYSSLPVEGTVGPCPVCGAKDPYHCGKGHVGPCSENVKPVPAAKAKPTQEVVWEKVGEYANDPDRYSPAVVKEIKGIAVFGHSNIATRTYEDKNFTVKLFAKDGNIAYSVVPANENGTDLAVTVETAAKVGRDPHQSLDVNLVVTENKDGKAVKTTKIFILSADATTL